MKPKLNDAQKECLGMLKLAKKHEKASTKYYEAYGAAFDKLSPQDKNIVVELSDK